MQTIQVESITKQALRNKYNIRYNRNTSADRLKIVASVGGVYQVLMYPHAVVWGGGGVSVTLFW